MLLSSLHYLLKDCHELLAVRDKHETIFFCLMIRRPPRSTQGRSSAASDVYKRQKVENTNGVPEKFEEERFNKLGQENNLLLVADSTNCLLYTSPSPRDRTRSRMPSSA